MDLSTHALRYFVALSEELHFGRTATRLHLTTPSLSEQIARIEKQLKASLFVRGPRGVELTDVGRELLPLARAVVDAQDIVLGWAAARTTTEAAALSVGVFGPAAAPFRTAVLEALSESHAQLKVSTKRLGRQEAFELLREGDVDIAYVPEPIVTDRPGIRWLTVSQNPRLLMTPAGHPLAMREAVSIEETNGETFITIDGADGESTAWWLVDPRADGTHPHRGPAAVDVDEILDLCAAGRGVAVVNALMVDHYRRPHVAFIPISDVEDARAAMCWRADESSPAVLSYLAIARIVARARPGVVRV